MHNSLTCVDQNNRPIGKVISVICPSYNRASFLEACVIPVMALSNSEFVLVDDGSTDETLKVATTLQQRYGKERIVVISLGGNQGAQVARNRGMESAKGEMILFCDSDDVLVASGVEKIVEALNQNPDLDYAYGKVYMTDESLSLLEGVSAIGCSFEDSPVEMAGYHWHTMGAIYRKNYLAKVGPWNPDLTGSQDWEYQARVKLAGGRGIFIETLVGYWRQHKGGRVGARKFRPDYVRSVAVACEVILQGSDKIGHTDSLLERRIGKKLFLHALEAASNNDPSGKDYCLEVGRRAIRHDNLIRGFLNILHVTPTWMNRYLYHCMKP